MPDREASLSEVGAALGAAGASVHREVERAEATGLVKTRKVGNVRLVSADTDSVYFDAMSELLTIAFGAPAVLSGALEGLAGIEAAYLFGSWAARWAGIDGPRRVGDLDVLVLGTAERSSVLAAVTEARATLRLPVQVTFRPADWLATGEGAFHATLRARPLVQFIDQGTSIAARTTSIAADARR